MRSDRTTARVTRDTASVTQPTTPERTNANPAGPLRQHNGNGNGNGKTRDLRQNNHSAKPNSSACLPYPVGRITSRSYPVTNGRANTQLFSAPARISLVQRLSIGYDRPASERLREESCLKRSSNNRQLILDDVRDHRAIRLAIVHPEGC